MSELAFNMHGDPFEVPAKATGWRVRRMKAKGAPEVVYGRNGLPLVLPIDAELDDLRAETTAPGRYRLDPIAENNKPIEDSPAGYVFVHDVAPATATVIERSARPPASDNIVIEAMRMNSELARSIVDRFPQMMESAALLIRAADGAGIPARSPREIEEDEAAEEGAAPAGGLDLNTIVAQAMPLLIAGLSGGKLPSLASVLDWRKAVPEAASSRANATPKAASAVKEPESDTSKVSADALPALDPATMAHFLAIQQALQPEEAALAREIASELQPAELRAWFDELAALSVPDAVTKIRGLIGKGGAS